MGLRHPVLCIFFLETIASMYTYEKTMVSIYDEMSGGMREKCLPL